MGIISALKQRKEQQKRRSEWRERCVSVIRSLYIERATLLVRDGEWETYYAGVHSDDGLTKSVGEWYRAPEQERREAIENSISHSGEIIRELADASFNKPNPEGYLRMLANKCPNAVREMSTGSKKPYVTPPFGQTGTWKDLKLTCPDLIAMADNAAGE